MWTNWNSCLGGGNIKLQLNLESTRHKTITFHYRKFSSLFYILVYEPLFLYIDNSGVSFICCGFLIVLKPFVADYSLSKCIVTYVGPIPHTKSSSILPGGLHHNVPVKGTFTFSASPSRSFAFLFSHPFWSSSSLLSPVLYRGCPQLVAATREDSLQSSALGRDTSSLLLRSQN